jgi:hypothetical protein
MKHSYVYRDDLRGVLTDDGRFAPGVTSILKRGLPMPEALARWKFTNPHAAQIAEHAATRGTAVHAAVESWLNGEAADPTHLTAADVEAVETFASLFADHHLFGVEEEILVDEGDLLYSGTADHVFAPARDLYCVTGEVIPAGVPVVGDLKTSKMVRESYHAQVAAYAYALNCDHACVWHLAPPGVTLHWIDLDAGWRIFRAAYTLASELPALQQRIAKTQIPPATTRTAA